MPKPDLKKLPFTTARLRSLIEPPKGRRYVYDAKTPSLTLCITSAGSRSFYWYGKIDKRPERIRLGRFPDVSLDEARRAAAELTGEVAKGRNPAAERKSRREAPTLADLFDHWIQYAKQHKKTWPEDQRKFDKYLVEWHSRRLTAIKKADVQKWHRKLGEEHGPYLANRAYSLLRAMFGKAAEIGFEGPNPCIGIRRFKETSRDRFLQPSEMRTFFEALAEEEPLWRDFFLLLLFCGARRSNVARMRWDEISLEMGVWRISGEDAKGGQPLIVVLPPPALEILRARFEANGESERVFPASRGGLIHPCRAWTRIIKRAAIQNLRMHDLRRSLGSWQAIAGSSLQIIAASLGHRDLKATQVYSRLMVDPVRESVNGAVESMRKAGGLLEGPIDTTSEDIDNGEA